MYEGEFNEKNKFEGKGVYLNSNDLGKYDGEWKNGRRDGRGIEINYPTTGCTNRYDGEWKNGQKNGRGIEISYSTRGINKYEGEWSFNSKNEQGVCIIMTTELNMRENGSIIIGME
jgi:hypothetical protein